MKRLIITALAAPLFLASCGADGTATDAPTAVTHTITATETVTAPGAQIVEPTTEDEQTSSDMDGESAASVTSTPGETGTVAPTSPPSLPEIEPAYRIEKVAEDQPLEFDFDFGPSELDSHGSARKNIGQLAGVVHPEGEMVAGFRLVELDPDFKCTMPDAPQATNGRYIGLRFEAETYPRMANYVSGLDQLFISPDYFWITDEDGAQETDSLGNSFRCISDDERMPGPLFANEKAAGWVVFDTAAAGGAIHLDKAAAGTPGEASWSWAF